MTPHPVGELCQRDIRFALKVSTSTSLAGRYNQSANNVRATLLQHLQRRRKIRIIGNEHDLVDLAAQGVITDNQHPHHQLRVNRRTAGIAVERL